MIFAIPRGSPILPATLMLLLRAPSKGTNGSQNGRPRNLPRAASMTPPPGRQIPLTLRSLSMPGITSLADWFPPSLPFPSFPLPSLLLLFSLLSSPFLSPSSPRPRPPPPLFPLFFLWPFFSSAPWPMSSLWVCTGPFALPSLPSGEVAYCVVRRGFGDVALPQRHGFLFRALGLPWLLPASAQRMNF